LDRIGVIPNFKYQVFVTNLPTPDIGSYTIIRDIPIPGEIKKIFLKNINL